MKDKQKLLIILLIIVIVIILFKINYKKEEYNYVPDIIKALEKLSYTNYTYDYELKLIEEEFKYIGSKYDYIDKGIYKYQDIEINYQIENDKCYNLENNEEIINVLLNANIKYLYIDYLIKQVDDAFTKCNKNNDLIECNNRDITMNFKIDNDIVEIYIKDNNDIYDLKYYNLDNVEKIESINKSRDKVSYDEVGNIKYVNVDDKKLIFYNISHVQIDGFRKYRFEIDKLEDILILSIAKVKKEKSIKYIFPNDLIVYVCDNNDKVYISLEKYDKEIRSKILKDE